MRLYASKPLGGISFRHKTFIADGAHLGYNICMAQLMTFEDVARESSLAKSTVYYYYRQGRGPRTIKLGRHLRVRREDFEAWLESDVFEFKGFARTEEDAVNTHPRRGISD
jgi:excisionase family DNA binding protein